MKKLKQDLKAVGLSMNGHLKPRMEQGGGYEGDSEREATG